MEQLARQTAADNDISAYVLELAQAAKAASHVLACASTASKNLALVEIANALGGERAAILEANSADLDAASALEPALIDRLKLNDERIAAMVAGVLQVAELPDPVGAITDLRYRPSGIQVGRMRVALGVIGIIYESRPNVTADAAALCLKAGNAALLRGGSEAQHSNLAIARCIRAGLAAAALPPAAVQIMATRDRAAVGHMLALNDLVDVVVPRGGKGLIERVSREARMPVIKHLDGVCHVFLDDAADAEKARRIAFNAKTQRYGTCNTMETLLATPSAADAVFPRLLDDYIAAGVELRGCERTCALHPAVAAASEADWYAEYLSPILAIRVVNDLDAAIAHIRLYGSQHTDAIVTENFANARRFLAEVDSSSVMVNASTRFADGFEYGLGAEIGISTDKFHARGPVGLEGLTSQKWIVLGDGQIRE